jgi:hypothetical protein
MAMTPYSGDTNVIGKLGTTPQERGLTTQQFKDKFDEGLKAFVEWFNLTHKTEFDAHLADNVTNNDGVHGLKVESGTFTPKLEGDSGTSNHTYSRQDGHYYKIGSLVWFTATISLSAKDAGMGGNVKFSGLPFIVSQHTSGAISEYGDIATGGKELVVSLRTGVNFGRLQLSGDNVWFLTLPASALANYPTITISGCYKV